MVHEINQAHGGWSAQTQKRQQRAQNYTFEIKNREKTFGRGAKRKRVSYQKNIRTIGKIENGKILPGWSSPIKI